MTTEPKLREIPRHPGYFVGDDGSVWTTKRKGGNDRAAHQRGGLRPLAIHRNRSGYCLVNLDVNGRNCSRALHQLVLEAFVGPRPNGMEACHYPDPDKTNNRLSNLRWDTHDENIKDRFRDRAPPTNKRCRSCGTMKPTAEFYKDSRASDGLKTECKRCHCARTVECRRARA